MAQTDWHRKNLAAAFAAIATARYQPSSRFPAERLARGNTHEYAELSSKTLLRDANGQNEPAHENKGRRNGFSSTSAEDRPQGKVDPAQD
jgi:hypothetical protein